MFAHAGCLSCTCCSAYVGRLCEAVHYVSAALGRPRRVRYAAFEHVDSKDPCILDLFIRTVGLSRVADLCDRTLHNYEKSPGPAGSDVARRVAVTRHESRCRRVGVGLVSRHGAGCNGTTLLITQSRLGLSVGQRRAFTPSPASLVSHICHEVSVLPSRLLTAALAPKSSGSSATWSMR